MNALLSFSNIVQLCIQDINQELVHCEKQLTTTNENIVELEKAIEKKSSSAQDIKLLIEENNKLLIENICLMTEQTKLINHYHQLLSVINNKNIKPKKVIVKDLMTYYEKYDKKDRIIMLNKYLQKSA